MLSFCRLEQSSAILIRFHPSPSSLILCACDALSAGLASNTNAPAILPAHHQHIPAADSPCICDSPLLFLSPCQPPLFPLVYIACLPHPFFLVANRHSDPADAGVLISERALSRACVPPPARSLGRGLLTVRCNAGDGRKWTATCLPSSTPAWGPAGGTGPTRRGFPWRAGTSRSFSSRSARSRSWTVEGR